MSRKACVVCKKDREITENFYTTNNIDTFPDGRLDTCKRCLTLGLNNHDTSTFLPILEIVDVPYIEDEWNLLLAKYGGEGKVLKPTSILGRYLSKMKLKQYKDYKFTDTAELNENNKKKMQVKQDAEKRQEILNASVPMEYTQGHVEEAHNDEEISASNITTEDKLYLIKKWGKNYTIDEGLKLEEFWNDMGDSYDIVTAAHKDYLKKICKVSLKMEIALDIDDIDGFQKLSRVYDALMKSAKFTAAQNKAESDNFIDSFCEFIDYCEYDGYYEKFDLEVPRDVVDKTISVMNEYTRDLVLNETNLASLLESSIEKMKREEEEEGELDENEDFINPDGEPIFDSDFEKFFNQQDEEHENDLKNGEEEEE